MKNIPFASMNNALAGQSGWVIGRGPTSYDLRKLCDVREPIFFINDAVSAEVFAAPDVPLFWFAHDANQRSVAPTIKRATAVLPEDGPIIKILRGPTDRLLATLPAVCLHRWHYKGKGVNAPLEQSRDELAASRELHLHSGTIHPLLHFAWYLGLKRLTFVGCDGINDQTTARRLGDGLTGYNPLLANHSGSAPWWNYTTIRREQDRLMAVLDMEAIYVGTPMDGDSPLTTPHTGTPRVIHLAWRGPCPRLVEEQIRSLRELNPGWNIARHDKLPASVSPSLRKLIDAASHPKDRGALIRLAWLIQRGGVALQPDVLCLGPLNPLLCQGAFVATQHGGTVSAAALGGPPGDPCWSGLATWLIQNKRASCGSTDLNDWLNDTSGGPSRLPWHCFNPFRERAAASEFARSPHHVRMGLLARLRDGLPGRPRPMGAHLRW